ncbi:MAG: mercuric [Beijerinckiaceae bacterium]|nr:MAG: mercuric [Beijerinckiaceae bacterium]
MRPDLCIIGSDPVGIEIAFAAAGLGVPCLLVTQTDAIDPASRPALQRLRALGCGIIEGTGAFADKDRFIFGECSIRARRFVLATGATSRRPAIIGIDLPPLWDARAETRDAGTQQHVLVLGAGPLGLARATVAHRSGCRVTILAEAEMLPGFDAEAIGILRPEFARRGITLREHVDLTTGTIHADAGSFTLTFTEGPGPITFTHIVLDCGLVAALDGLDLDKAGLRLEDGRPVLSPALRSTNRRIYVAGDATGIAASLSHGKQHAGTILSEVLFRKSAPIDPALQTRLALTSPAIAEIGLRESGIGPGQRGRYRFYRVSFAETGDHHALKKGPSGQIKVIATRKGQICGVSILGEDAAELIVPFTLAIAKGIGLQTLATLPIARPCHAEAIAAVARQAVIGQLRSPGSLRLIRFLRIFG